MKDKHALNKSLYPEESFTPPGMNYLVQLRWWSTLEAAFILSEWPKTGLYSCTISPRELIPEDVRKDRPSFYLPGAGDGINERNYGADFQKIFRELNDDINYEKLNARSVRVDIGVNYLLEPFEVIMWAIRKKYKIPQELEEALFVRVKKQRQEEPWHKKVIIIVVGQFCLLDNPEATFKDVIESELMKKYCSKNLDENQKMQVRKDLRVVLENGKPGRPKKIKNSILKRKSKIQPIPEVLSESGGHKNCNFALLKTVLSKTVIIIRDEILGMKSAMVLSEFEFIEYVSEHPLVQIYLRDAPPFLSKFIIASVQSEYKLIRELNWWNALSRYFTAKPSWKVKINSLTEQS